MDDILKKLEQILEDRKSAKADESYVSSLYAKGLDEILKKIGEESTEVVMAAKDGDKDKIIYEVADLWFHTLVLLRHKDIEIDKIQQELSRRFGLSGLEEKANRNN
jgi:phosphoribosyl-ATP pyrophosphohydrolase